jgi:hypothetical protein
MAEQEQEAPQPDYNADGVDVSLIRLMLALSPAERLQVLEQHLSDVLKIWELNAHW